MQQTHETEKYVFSILLVECWEWNQDNVSNIVDNEEKLPQNML